MRSGLFASFSPLRLMEKEAGGQSRPSSLSVLMFPYCIMVALSTPVGYSVDQTSKYCPTTIQLRKIVPEIISVKTL